ncbi:MAG: M81 family metallopeptidase [bacterium]|nr:M81 family metallopeptidase [bacterium]
MKVLVGHIGHESNTFTPHLTQRSDFHLRFGDEMLQEGPLLQAAIGGIIDTLVSEGVELKPSLIASAMPGGVVERASFEEFSKRLLAAAVDIDGVCLHLHGAMRTEGIDYCEAAILAELRRIVGPDIPVVISLDMHANITADLVAQVDALTVYHTAPHIDTYDTGVRAARLLLGILRHGVRPRIGLARIPFLLPGEMAQTDLPPMLDVMNRVAQLEAQPGILAAAVANGHCWADIPDLGVAAVVVTDNDLQLAHAGAAELAELFWSRRADFAANAEAVPIEEAVTLALVASESTVFLSDTGDNPGAGGTTDVTALLAALLMRDVQGALFSSIRDEAAVAACREAGIGADVALSIGGKIERRHGESISVNCEVLALFDQRESYDGRELEGPVALVRCRGVDIILSTGRLNFLEPIQYERLGLDPLSYRLVAIKRGYLTAALQAICPRSILALTPGATDCRIEEMPFTRLRRPVYPIDRDMAWVGD